MPGTRSRSCLDMSVSNVQSTINFPQRKTRHSVTTKRVTEKENTSGLKKKTTQRTRKKRVVPQNDENACSPVKTPRKDVLTPLKSPLTDSTNIQNPIPDTTVVKRKLLLSHNDTTGACYNDIRQALHTSIPSDLISRDQELSTIREFVDRTIKKSKQGSLYMSGAPGTGKTACLTKVLEDVNCEKIKSVFLNCMSLRCSQSIFSKLAEVLKNSSKPVPSKDAMKYLEKTFTASGPRILLVLDEIDQLESKNQEVLYKLFEMPFLPKSRLVLIGIANALDLTDRILPRLQAKATCKPLLLQFPPYSKDDIASILQERLKEINSNVVDNTAIQFCARKVSAMSGDARKALDILRRAVEIVESDTRKEKTVDANPKKVTISHVSSVCTEVYGARMSMSANKMTIPLQQKIFICTLMVCLKDKKLKEVTIPKLYEAYCRVCRPRQINIVNQEEFGGLCTLLESQGIIAVKTSKDARNNKVSLRLQENEVEHALQDKTLMSSILSDGVPS